VVCHDSRMVQPGMKVLHTSAAVDESNDAAMDSQQISDRLHLSRPYGQEMPADLAALVGEFVALQEATLAALP
jgi:hypothetical protein